MRSISLILPILAFSTLANCSEIKTSNDDPIKSKNETSDQTVFDEPDSSRYSLRLIKEGEEGPLRPLKYRSLSEHEKRMVSLRNLLEKAQKEREEQNAKEKKDQIK